MSATQSTKAGNGRNDERRWSPRRVRPATTRGRGRTWPVWMCRISLRGIKDTSSRARQYPLWREARLVWRGRGGGLLEERLAHRMVDCEGGNPGVSEPAQV